MKTKASFRYMMHDFFNGMLIFYVIFFAIYIFTIILVATSGGKGSINSIDFATVIFMFVGGLNSFKECFGMLLQNGTSRKTMFASRVMSFSAIAGLMSVSNLLFSSLFSLLPKNLSIETGQTMLVKIYGSFGSADIILSLLLSFSLFLFFLLLGYCITTLFYRIGRIGKVLVGAGVPVLLTVVLPVVDTMFFSNNISIAMFRFFSFAFGLSTCQPLRAVASFLIGSGIFALCGWLLTRKATVRH